MQPLGWLKKIWKDQRGNALVIGAAAMPLLIGAAAIGVDTIQVSVARRQLQRSADSAALAGAYALAQSQPVANSVNHDLALNDDVVLSGSPVIENAPTTGAYAGNPRAVRVVLAANRSVPFISFFLGSTMAVSAEATAAIVYTGKFCVVSLEDGNNTGISFGGNTTVNLGCGMISNSRSSAAISAGGSAQVTASPLAAVGGVPPNGAYLGNTVRLSYSPPQIDPYAALSTPTVPANCNNQYSQSPNKSPPALRPVSPGIFCYRGMDLKGTVTLPPGIYIIDGDSLSFGAQANVTGTGVTFILTSRTAATTPSSIANLSMNGGARVNLAAPSSGSYAGVLMYQDRRALYGGSQINGNSSSRLQGAFYFPSRELTFSGNTGMQTECIQLVARRLSFTGSSTIQNNCPANSGSKAFEATVVRLVG